MSQLEETYQKIWKIGSFTVEANIDRSLWEEKILKKLENNLGLILLDIFESSKANYLKNNILISVLFAGDKKITELNKHYRNINLPTNILSFPSSNKLLKNETFLGDIIFASETIFREVNKDNKNLENHLIHLFIHGVLHLLGYDHETINDAKSMESLEIRILKNLNIDNPYQEIL